MRNPLKNVNISANQSLRRKPKAWETIFASLRLTSVKATALNARPTKGNRIGASISTEASPGVVSEYINTIM